MRTNNRLFVIVLLMILMPIPILADTLRLRNGSTLKGKVLRFDGKEFTVTLDGTQSRAIVLLGDVESIEFDASPVAPPIPDRPMPREETAAPDTSTRPPLKQEPPTAAAPEPEAPPPAEPAGREYNIDVSAREVWVDSGVDVTVGQRVKISASGRVTLAAGRTTGPEGTDLKDPDKLLENEATGGLIGVIGDDNDEFFFVGASKEIVAKRGGRLFLMLNEGSLEDNSGAFKVRVQLTGSSSKG